MTIRKVLQGGHAFDVSWAIGLASGGGRGQGETPDPLICQNRRREGVRNPPPHNRLLICQHVISATTLCHFFPLEGAAFPPCGPAPFFKVFCIVRTMLSILALLSSSRLTVKFRELPYWLRVRSQTRTTILRVMISPGVPSCLAAGRKRHPRSPSK